MKQNIEAGFTYTAEVFNAKGELTDREVIKNLMPDEGVSHVLSTILKGGAPVTNWYIGLFEGNYTPDSNDVAATFSALSSECTAYTSGTRLAFTPGTVSAGNVDNAAAKAEFTFNADKTVYGGSISSASAKGSTSGVLLSVVRFGSPKSIEAGGVLRVTAGFTLASA